MSEATRCNSLEVCVRVPSSTGPGVSDEGPALALIHGGHHEGNGEGRWVSGAAHMVRVVTPLDLFRDEVHLRSPCQIQSLAREDEPGEGTHAHMQQHLL